MSLLRAANNTLLLRDGRLGFSLDDDDIFIVSYPRSGTTLTQMILYQLCTPGTTDFEHIDGQIPWFERTLLQQRPFQFGFRPRIFKSHLRSHQVPRGRCRYIYVWRDGRDVAVSYYHLLRGVDGYPGTFDQFFHKFLAGAVTYGAWFPHVEGWLQNRHHLDVLFLRYRDLVHDPVATVDRIVEFCGFAVTDEVRHRAVARSRFDYMKKYESRFAVAPSVYARPAVQAAEPFLRAGQSGAWPTRLTAGQVARFNEVLAEYPLVSRQLALEIRRPADPR